VSPPPVFARRQPKPQYLAPGQHLKVASRRPQAKEVPAQPVFPRDPWEAQDDTEDEDRPRSPRASPPGLASSAEVGGAGGRSPHVRHSTGGHPFSSHLSRSRSTAQSESTPRSDVDKGDFFAEGSAAAAANEHAEAEERSYYHSTQKEAVLTAAERAQRVLEMQQQALEAKQLKALVEQGIARRPKTLVRNRHGRLQAIAAQSPATSTDATLRIADAPVAMRAKPRPGDRTGKGPKVTTAPLFVSAAKTASTVATGDGGDLVNSRPSTPREGGGGGASRLQIDPDK
jgi:hypothetical protein